MPHKYCEYPAIQDCYKPSIPACWQPLQSQDNITRTALDALPDQNVSAKIRPFLLNGTNFQSTWQIEPAADVVYLSTQKFLAVRFTESLQSVQEMLRLKAAADAKYKVAHDALSSQFDDVFFKACAKKRTFPFKPTLLRQSGKQVKLRKIKIGDSQCAPARHALCCKTAVCDCSKRQDSPGQCSPTSYSHCCGAKKTCDCRREPTSPFTGFIV